MPTKRPLGQRLRFDLGYPNVETWWYAVCDNSTTVVDAESRLDAIRYICKDIWSTLVFCRRRPPIHAEAIDGGRQAVSAEADSGMSIT